MARMRPLNDACFYLVEDPAEPDVPYHCDTLQEVYELLKESDPPRTSALVQKITGWNPTHLVTIEQCKETPLRVRSPRKARRATKKR